MAEDGLIPATTQDVDRPYGPGWLKLEDQRGEVVIEDANIVFRNFAGHERQFNREGDRNFCVTIPPHIAEMMIEDHWNVKQLKPRPDGSEGDFYIQVTVGFRGKRPPNLWLVSSKGRFKVEQHRVEVFDWVDIARADMIINPSHYDVNGKKGVKAYVKTLVIHIAEDYLEMKYELAETGEPTEAEMPELPAGDDDQDPTEDLDIVEGEIVEES